MFLCLCLAELHVHTDLPIGQDTKAATPNAIDIKNTKKTIWEVKSLEINYVRVQGNQTGEWNKTET